MADIEKQFIYALLRATKAEQSDFSAKRYSLGIFPSAEKQMYWLQTFRAKHGSYPSVEAYESRFQETLPKTRETLAVALQPILDAALFAQIREHNLKAKQLLDSGEPMSAVMQFYRQGAQALQGFDQEYGDSNFSSSSGPRQRYKTILRETQNPAARMMTTPWPAMTKLLKRLRPGNVGYLVGRNKMGKTWMLLLWAEHLALLGFKVLFISLELTTEEVEDRLECMRYKLGWNNFLDGKLSGKEIRQWNLGRKRKVPSEFIVTGEESLKGSGFDSLRDKIERYRPDIVFVDSTYLMNPGVHKSAQQNERFGAISRGLKPLAKYYKVPLIGSLQFNRESEAKDGNSKGASKEVYGSDAWVQDSDFTFGIDGKRGSPSREVRTLGTRSAAYGIFRVNFQVDPWPDFLEMSGSVQEEIKVIK